MLEKLSVTADLSKCPPRMKGDKYKSTTKIYNLLLFPIPGAGTNRSRFVWQKSTSNNDIWVTFKLLAATLNKAFQQLDQLMYHTQWVFAHSLERTLFHIKIFLNGWRDHQLGEVVILNNPQLGRLSRCLYTNFITLATKTDHWRCLDNREATIKVVRRTIIHVHCNLLDTRVYWADFFTYIKYWRWGEWIPAAMIYIKRVAAYLSLVCVQLYHTACINEQINKTWKRLQWQSAQWRNPP